MNNFLSGQDGTFVGKVYRRDTVGVSTQGMVTPNPFLLEINPLHNGRQCRII